MSGYALLINGITLPYHVLDKGLSSVVNSKADIKAVFVYETRSQGKEYVFPNDIELTKPGSSEHNAEKNLESLIQHNVKYVENYFLRKAITIETIILRNPTAKDITDIMTGVDEIYLDHESFEYPDEFANVDFSIKHLEKILTSKLNWIKP